MGTRLDQVLATGMARLCVAPVPTGGAAFDSEVYNTVDKLVKELVANTQDKDDEAVSKGMREIVRKVMEQYKLPFEKYKTLLGYVGASRRKFSSRRLMSLEQANARRQQAARQQAAREAAGSPLIPKRQLSSEKHVEERRDAKLQLVEKDLEDLIGKKPSNIRREALNFGPQTRPSPTPGERSLTDDERQLIAEFLKRPRSHGFGTLAKRLGLTKDQMAKVVKSEQKRIARLAFRERAAINSLGEKLNNAIKEYADALEAAIANGTLEGERKALVARREGIMAHFGMLRSQVRNAAYRELLRRQQARFERDKPILLEEGDAALSLARYKLDTRPHSRARSPVNPSGPLTEPQLAALAEWAQTRAVLDRVPWNHRVQELRELCSRFEIRWALAVRYMKENTRFKSGFKAMDGKGYIMLGGGNGPLTEGEVEVTRSADFRSALAREEREREAEEAFWMRLLDEEESDGVPGWLSDILDQWESAFDDEAFNASEFDTLLAHGIGQVEVELTEEEMRKQQQLQEYEYDALDAVLFADEAGIAFSDDDADNADDDAGVDGV